MPPKRDTVSARRHSIALSAAWHKLFCGTTPGRSSIRVSKAGHRVGGIASLFLRRNSAFLRHGIRTV